jgi:hypothetical protein
VLTATICQIIVVGGIDHVVEVATSITYIIIKEMDV